MYQVVGIGEILWDVFPDGAKFGGAPANFACSFAGIAQNRFEVYMVSSVGQDELGQQALKALGDRDVRTSHVLSQDRVTGQVLVSLDDHGVASYDFVANTAWDNLSWREELAALARTTDVVCFGSLGQRSHVSRATIQRFLDAVPRSAIRIFDINIRRPHYDPGDVVPSLERANVLKLNEEELPEVSHVTQLTGSDRDVIEQLAERFQLRCVALTRGPDGALVWSEGAFSEHTGFVVDVVDTVGAGDAYTAVLGAGLRLDVDIAEINDHACRLAAYVCSCPGATPTNLPEVPFLAQR